MWNFITETNFEQIADAGLRSEVLLQFWSHVMLWLDSIIESLIVVFTAEREQWQCGAVARRLDAVRAILAGQVVDIAEATATPVLTKYGHCDKVRNVMA